MKRIFLRSVQKLLRTFKPCPVFLLAATVPFLLNISYLDIIRRHHAPPAFVSVHQSSVLGDIKEGIEIIQFEIGFLKLLIIPISRMNSIRDANPAIGQVRPVRGTVRDRRLEIPRTRSIAASMISARHKVPEILPESLHLLRVQRLVVVPENDERSIPQRAIPSGLGKTPGPFGCVD